MKKFKVMNPSGEMRDVAEDKLHLAESDNFLPVVSNGKENRRVSLGKLPMAQADGFKLFYDAASEAEGEASRMAEIKYEYDKPLGVAVRSVTRGLSADFADEIGGALGAVADQVKGSEKTFAESYKENRDYERLKQRVDDINHPVATTVGRIGGGVASGGLLPGAAAFGGSIGYGAAQGVGASEAEDLEGIAKDAGVGAAFGAGGYGVGRLMQAAPGAVTEGAKRLGTGVRAGAREAMQQGPANEAFLDTAITVASGGTIPAPLRMFRALKAGWSEAKSMSAAQKEIDDIAVGLRKTFGPGLSQDLSNEEVLMVKLLEPGDNIAKQFVASKYAMAHGGDAKQYLNLLNRSADETAAARAFDKVKAGEDLAPQFDDAYKSLRSETSNRYRSLTDEARAQFQKVDVTPIEELQTILKTIEDDTTVSTTSKNYIREGLKRLGDDFADQDAATQFDRLVAAKDKLKGGSKWAARNEVPEGAVAVRDASNSVDKYLKALDARKTADAEWTSLSRLEDSLFKKIGEVKGGKVQRIDPIKLEKIFSGTASGRQLMKEVLRAEEVLATGKLPPEKVASIQKVIDTIKAYADKSDLNRDISKFRYVDAGPSSPTIQRLGASLGQDSATITAVKSPQIFLKMREAAVEGAQLMYGKPFNSLSATEKEAVGKYALWIAKNPGVDLTAANRMATSFKDPKFKP